MVDPVRGSANFVARVVELGVAGANEIARLGGELLLAALLSGAWVPPDGARVGVLVCGSNTDPAQVAA